MAVRTTRILKNIGMLNTEKNSFFKYTSIPNENGCMEWLGCIMQGYGVFSRQGKTQLAHRFSYQYFIGPILDNLFVCHKCDNRKCVNPDHLFLGTNNDNMQDKMKKGRQHYGSNYKIAKLNEIKVKEIRKLLKSNNFTHQQIAAKYEVSRKAISKIANNQTWVRVQ